MYEKNKQLILIVDDNATNLAVLSETLKMGGYSIAVEMDGESALEQVKYHTPDLILLDITMPGIDGFETCKRLKESSESKDIPIIFITASDSTSNMVKSFSLGAVDYITKPFRAEELFMRVKTHLQIKQLNLDLIDKNNLLQEEIKEKEIIQNKLTNTLKKLKKAQKQIIAKERLASLGILTAGIADELKNPLNFINNFAQISQKYTKKILTSFENITKNFTDLEKQDIQKTLKKLTKSLEAIEEEGEQANKVINSMLLHAKQGDNDKKITNINELINQSLQFAIKNFQSKFKIIDINLETEYDDTIPPINVFSQSLNIAFFNILNNACYTLNKKKQIEPNFRPTIRIKTKYFREKIDIFIKDNGEGISHEFISNIFDPFFTTKPTNQSTGLGLFLTYDIIVNQHEGDIKINTKKGDFTEFIINFDIK